MYKRIISFLLAAALCFGMLPVTVLAEETEAGEETIFTEALQEEIQETQTATETEPSQAEETQEETNAWTEATEETEAAEETETTEETEAAEETESPLPEEETTGETVAEETALEAVDELVPEEEPEIVECTDWVEYALDDGGQSYTSEEAFAAYAERVFYGLELMPFGTAAGRSLTGNDKIIYDILVPELKKVANGERASTKFTIGGFGSEFPTRLESDGTTNFCDWDLILSALRADLAYELYWADLYNHKADEGATVISSQYYTDFSDIQLTVRISVAASYREGSFETVKNKNYYCAADTEKTGKAKEAANNAWKVVETYAGRDDYHKLKAYADWIADAVEYNDDAVKTDGYASDHIDPWQLIYVFDGDKTTDVVCEGYSKAFQYLCDLSVFNGDVTCYRVWGSTNGGHMWNTVNLDGAVYLVDVTNYDRPTRWDWLFMAGAEKNADGSYTFKKGLNSVTYTYDSEMYQIYDPGEALELAAVKYDPNHQHSFPEEPAQKTDPTCTSSGEEVFICAGCGLEKTETLAALGHDPELRNAKEATCTEKGYSGDMVCIRCEKITKAGRETAMAAHTLVKQGAVAATCTLPGKLDDSYCASCKQVIEAGAAVDALGHDIIRTGGAKDATCTEDGKEADESCTRCDYHKTGAAIPKLGHDLKYGEKVDATCTQDGHEADITCTRCDYRETGAVIPALGHLETLQGEKEVSCMEDGYTGDKICGICGAEMEKGAVIPALGHDIQKSGAKEPTCTEDGNEDNETCSRCDYQKAGERIPMLGHDLQYSDGADATCTQDGREPDASCARCGYQKPGSVIPAFGHKKVIRGEKEASCTEDGYTGDVVCTVCEETLEYGEVIPMGHTMGYRRIPGKEPTDTECGEKTYAQPYCAVCQTPWITEDGQEMSGEEIQAFWEENVVTYASARSVAIVTEGGGEVPTAAAKGKGLTLIAQVLPAAAEQRVTWKSSAPTVISVDENGYLAFLKNGKATITATTADKCSAKVTIQVTTLAQKITVSSKTGSNEVGAGKKLALVAAVEPEDTVNRKVSWSITEGSEYAQVSSSGVVTAKKVLPEGDGLVTVRAAALDGSGVYGECQIQVLPLAETVTIGDQGLGGILDKNQGYTWRLTTVVTPENASQKVIWSSSNTKVATVNEDGVVTAERSGTTTITAKTADGSNRSAKYTLTVTAPITRLHLTADLTMRSPDPHMFPSSTTLGAGQSMTITAVAEPEDAATKKVYWSVDNTDAATISSSGVLKAKNVQEPVDVTVTAVSQENPDVQCTMTVTVYPSAITKIGLLVDGAAYNKTSLTIENQGFDLENSSDFSEDLDKLHSVKVVLTPSTASPNMRWTQNNYDVLTIVNCSDGEIRLNPQKAGTCTLTGTALDGSGKKVTLKVTVTQPITGLTLPETAAVAGGKRLTLNPVTEPADATSKKLTWTVSANTVGATISSGVLKTKAVKSPTTVTVTATAMDGSGVSASCPVTIYPATTSLELRKDERKVTALTLGIGEEETITAFAKPEGLTFGEVDWISNKPGVATVENGTVTAAAPGKAVITAIAADGSGKKASLTVTVVRKVESLSISGGTAAAGGKSLTLKATVQPANATNKKLSWKVDKPAAATISASGVLKAKAVKEPTEVTVTAAATDGSGVSASWTVTIYPAATKITLRSGGSAVGSSLKCYADQLVKLDAVISPSGAYQKVSWSTSSGKTAVVNSSGVVIPLKPGTVTITATAADGSGKKASVKLTILAPAD